tara:strand:- start:2614 stop:3474 length:861 start_codon:yes stop_codon:yes gene_type:complete
MKNIPKVMYLYWDGGTMSFLNYLTVISFHKHNPSWDIVVYTPTNKHEGITWSTGEQSVSYDGTDYWGSVGILDYVEIRTFDFTTIEISNDIPEVFKSDFIRWHILSTMGGGWSDFDILYTKPINEIDLRDNMVTGIVEEVSTVLVFDGYHHIIGFYLSEPNNKFFGNILEKSKTSLNPGGYQSVGSRLLMKMYPNLDVVGFSHNNVANLPMDVVYPIIPSHKTIHDLFNNSNMGDYFTNNTIGVHWFNGDKLSKEYLNNFTSTKTNGSIISKLIEEYEDIYSNSLL